jgi:hypothetical protein
VRRRFCSAHSHARGAQRGAQRRAQRGAQRGALTRILCANAPQVPLYAPSIWAEGDGHGQNIVMYYTLVDHGCNIQPQCLSLLERCAPLRPRTRAGGRVTSPSSAKRSPATRWGVRLGMGMGRRVAVATGAGVALSCGWRARAPLTSAPACTHRFLRDGVEEGGDCGSDGGNAPRRRSRSRSGDGRGSRTPPRRGKRRKISGGAATATGS